jgi:hypothetical protein
MDNDRTSERRTVVGLVLTAALCVWLSLVAMGFKGQMDAMNAPGPESSPPARWPADASLRRSASGPTLVLFGHPRCPCTPASLRQLGDRVARAAGPVDVHVVFFRPSGGDADWRSGPAWDAARTIPGARLHDDEDGALARRFGARASGLLAVYGTDGALLLRGGLTAGRGASGPSAGADALDAVLAGRRPAFEAIPVYGCAILDESLSGKGP